jgi:hypothetical protein
LGTIVIFGAAVAKKKKGEPLRIIIYLSNVDFQTKRNQENFTGLRLGRTYSFAHLPFSISLFW